jgi:dihydrofolate synthase/folylpolyglutamate synthase
MGLKSADHEVWSFGLDRIRLALNLLGHPERTYRTVLVGGTNGKGSTCIFLERILAASGLSVGVNISPHVSSYSERFRLNGRCASLEEIAALEKELNPILKEISLTYFEWCVVIAAALFSQHKVDVGIFEIGLGGRLDAANAIEPDISIITDISIDHTDFLGTTIDAIAKEKAAIARPKKPLFTTAKQDALKVIAEHTQTIGASLHIIDENSVFQMSLSGKHQARNAMLALKAAEFLGVRLNKNEYEYAMNTAFLAGRIETVGFEHPKIILDVAHNPSSVICLVQYLNQIKFKGIVVLGILADKDYETMVGHIKSVAKKIFMAPVRSKRSWEMCHMANIGGSGEHSVFESVSDAFDAALATNEDILVTGSFYTVGEVRDRIICQG